MSIRDSFVARFGEDQAAAIEAAADEHANGINDSNKGSDPFKWAVSLVIGYECASKDRYRKYHGITAPWDEVHDWIKTDADLASHDGDVDYLALVCGSYNEYMQDKEEVPA